MPWTQTAHRRALEQRPRSIIGNFKKLISKSAPQFASITIQTCVHERGRPLKMIFQALRQTVAASDSSADVPDAPSGVTNDVNARYVRSFETLPPFWKSMSRLRVKAGQKPRDYLSLTHKKLQVRLRSAHPLRQWLAMPCQSVVVDLPSGGAVRSQRRIKMNFVLIGWPLARLLSAAEGDFRLNCL